MLQRLPKSLRDWGARSAVASPIIVEGRCWGGISVASLREPFPPATEERLVEFTEIVATAIANAESRAQLVASRARVVAAGDDMRRRLERDLHDGAQQRLVSLALELRAARDTVPQELPALRTSLGQAGEDLTDALDELREISRGLHPAILAEGGLGPALRTLARRAPIQVELQLETESRYAAPVEVATYYVVSEALTNTIKHGGASHAQVSLEERANKLLLRVGDDGVGGAESRDGSGLVGLRDRIEALDGSIKVVSPIGHGTSIEVSLPIERAA
jgi:signal transduction histidine kinase